ncbi:MAG: exonuclease domain-containing protein [Lachnospiraceae bacterium]|nr:exonuclease domain-containing protein [Lachnospiraceae bacterium]
MRYIIFDLEWNQPFDEAATIQEPVYLTGEIVEIGAVKLDENFCPMDELRLYITPKFYTKMHKQIAALTGIHDKDLAERGIPFPEAYQKFVSWCGEEYAFMTWSMNDMPMLIDNMILHGIDVSDLPECYDIQRIFSREIMHGETRYSLDTALTLLKEKGDTSHDALHDARNTAKVCDHLDLEEYLHEYTSKVFAEKPTGTRYETRKQILSDPSLSEFYCPWCGKPIKCEPWISLGGNTHVAYGVCSDGDEFLVQLSVVYHQRREYSTKRIIFEMSDDLWDIYMDKKEALGA